MDTCCGMIVKKILIRRMDDNKGRIIVRRLVEDDSKKSKIIPLHI